MLTGRRVTIKFKDGEAPGKPFEDSWAEPPTREERMDHKVEGRWKGYTFFELQDPNRGTTLESYYVGQRPAGTEGNVWCGKLLVDSGATDGGGGGLWTGHTAEENSKGSSSDATGRAMGECSRWTEASAGGIVGVEHELG